MTKKEKTHMTKKEKNTDNQSQRDDKKKANLIQKQQQLL